MFMHLLACYAMAMQIADNDLQKTWQALLVHRYLTTLWLWSCIAVSLLVL